MHIEHLKIPGMTLITLKKHGDSRGYFMETYRHSICQEAGMPYDFVQDNRSLSGKNVLRGMHYQIKNPQGHMISVLRGHIFDVGVDLRKNSPTFGQWCGVELSADIPQQLFLPPGVAHGYCTFADENELYYKCTDYYYPDDEGGLLWCDLDVGIQWPIENPQINDRDAHFAALMQIPDWHLPQALL